MKTYHIRLHGCARMVTGFCLAWMVSWASTAGAQITSTWDTTNGAYSIGSNWHNDIVPDQADDVAVFDQSGTFTVDGFGTGITNLNAVVGYTSAGDGLNVTFDLEEQTWSLTSTQDGVDGPAALTVGDGEGGAVNATMTVTNGTLDANGVVLGRQGVENSSGTLIISGAGATLTAPQKTQRVGVYGVWVGAGSTGTLRIEDGATATVNGLVMGYTAGAADRASHLVVTGLGSKLTVETTRLWTHGAGSGVTITISDQATLEVTNQVRMNAGGTTMNIENATVIQTHAGAFSVAASKGSVNVLDGGLLDVVTLSVAVNISAADMPVVNVVPGGRLEVSGVASVGVAVINHSFPYRGKLVVSGAGAEAEIGTLRINSLVYATGNYHGEGTVHVHDGGVVDVLGTLTVSEQPHGDDTGEDAAYLNNAYLEVLGSGSQLKANNAYLGGTATAVGGDAYATIGGGGRLEVANLLHAYGTAELTLDSEGAVDTMIQAGSLELVSGSLLKATLYGAQRTAGAGAAGNALMWVTGSGVAENDPAATITDAILHLTLDGDYVAELNDVFTLMQVDGTLDGTFKDLANNAIVFSGLGVNEDLDLRINYISDNDSVTLTVIPEPGVAGLLLAGMAGLLALRRRRASLGG